MMISMVSMVKAETRCTSDVSRTAGNQLPPLTRDVIASLKSIINVIRIDEPNQSPADTCEGMAAAIADRKIFDSLHD